MPVTWSDVPTIVGFLVLGSLVGASIGHDAGHAGHAATGSTSCSPWSSTPLLFTGSTQFPWRRCDSLRWFQVVCALNPLTYVSEALRAEMVPGLPHIPLWVCALALLGFLAAFGVAGLVGFRRRALD